MHEQHQDRAGMRQPLPRTQETHRSLKPRAQLMGRQDSHERWSLEALGPDAGPAVEGAEFPAPWFSHLQTEPLASRGNCVTDARGGF